uniref:Membrane protein n=1 Tax=Pithovirus LCDPAC01 TaxID=2506600 RepID=A0A481YQC0_9VIRU|nr:MAG: membrane protein [Pithovirus LCDPAC01]
MSGYGKEKAMGHKMSMKKHGMMEKEYKHSYLTWLVVSFIVVALFLYVFRPGWLLKADETDENNRVIDWGKLLLLSLVISLICLAILYLFRSNYGQGYGHKY